MRYVMPLFVVSAALFVFGLGFTVIGARDARRAPAAAVAAEAAPVANVRQLMLGVITPTATAIYESVGTSVTEKGVEETFPRDDEAWALLGANAAALAEAGELLITGGRAVDQGEWVTIARAMSTAAKEAIAAAAAKDKDKILSAGSNLNETCDNCHARYRRD